MPALDIRMLGPVQVRVDGTPLVFGGPRVRALVARLLVDRGRMVGDDYLVAAVWGDRPPQDRAAGLQQSVHKVRRALRDAGLDGAAILRRESAGYLLDIAEPDCDLGRFRAGRESARDAAARGEPDVAARLLHTALAQWSGEPVADLRGEPYFDDLAVLLEAERRAALTERIDADMARGRHNDVLGDLHALVDLDPYAERLWTRLVSALYHSGRQADALAACRRVRALLREIGTDPGPELVDLERRVLHHELAEPSGAIPRTTLVADRTAGWRVRLRLPDRVVELDGGRLRIGREPGSGLVLDDDYASRQHAEIVRTPAGLLLRDLGATNPTLVGGAELPFRGERRLVDGDEIRIGTTTMVVEIIAAP